MTPRRAVSGILVLIALAYASVSCGQAQNAASDFFNSLAAGSGNSWAQEELKSRAVADGMKELVQIMEANGHDPQRAMMTYLQTPNGQRLTKVPGALPLLIESFNAIVALPSRRR